MERYVLGQQLTNPLGSAFKQYRARIGVCGVTESRVKALITMVIGVEFHPEGRTLTVIATLELGLDPGDLRRVGKENAAFHASFHGLINLASSCEEPVIGGFSVVYWNEALTAEFVCWFLISTAWLTPAWYKLALTGALVPNGMFTYDKPCVLLLMWYPCWNSWRQNTRRIPKGDDLSQRYSASTE